MTPNGVLQIAVFFMIVLALTKPMGAYMTKVFAGERTFLHPVLHPLERFCYTAGGVKESVEQRWTQYAASLLAFSIFSFLILSESDSLFSDTANTGGLLRIKWASSLS